MARVTLSGGMAGLYFEVANAIDDGAKATVEEAQTAMENGNTMNLLDRFHETDLSLYGEAERRAINQLFQAHVADRPSRLGYRDNGLGYIAGTLVRIIVHGEWVHPETGDPVDVSSLVIEIG